jgi:hypothetical protein
MPMVRLLNKKGVLFALALLVSIFFPFLLPPHADSTYVPLVSLLLESDVWCGEADGAFYFIFFAEWVAYFFFLYCVGKLVIKATDKFRSHRIADGSA